MTDDKKVEVCVLRCVCGCGEIAVSLDGTRITDAEGGPWFTLYETQVNRSEVCEAIGVTGYD